MKVQELGEQWGSLLTAKKASDERLLRLGKLHEGLAGSGLFVCVNGSLARGELVDGSDFDAFVVRNKRATANPKEVWDQAYNLVDLKGPGSTGVFGGESVIYDEDMLLNIGGSDDTNEKITRRMLFFLESVPVGDTEIFECLVDGVLKRYISDNITDHQLALFLLNDIIRYYRTVCVDFEFKTEEDRKPWGIRNIKLVFSRKLIYFSGLLICAETAQRSASEKREICKKLMKLTPIDRLLKVLGSEALEPLRYYDRFLGSMAEPETRKSLEQGDRETIRNSDTFRSLKNDGHHFSMSLRSSFNRHYDSSHPIHRAIMF